MILRLIVFSMFLAALLTVAFSGPVLAANENASKLNNYTVLNGLGMNGSKLNNYMLLNQFGENGSKFNNYMLLNQTLLRASKLNTYLLLQTKLPTAYVTGE
jgi:hypothetical protein